MIFGKSRGFLQFDKANDPSVSRSIDRDLIVSTFKGERERERKEERKRKSERLAARTTFIILSSLGALGRQPTDRSIACGKRKKKKSKKSKAQRSRRDKREGVSVRKAIKGL